MFQFNQLSILLLVSIFAACAAAIWIAGIYLSKNTGILTHRFKLGEALGGLILLAIVTNLPELIITLTAALENNLELAIGNILGGIAMQTVVLVLLDKFGLPKNQPLTKQVSTMQLVMEGLLVVGILVLVIIGHQMPTSIILFHITSVAALIVFTWIIGLFLINKAKNNFSWVPKKGTPQKVSPIKQQNQEKKKSTTVVISIFVFTALITMIAGYGIEKTGDVLAGKLGMQGIIFGATILAAATSLPKISTGLASMKIKKYGLAVSDIFGGNAFLPVLFLLATLCSGKAVLPGAQRTDIYLTAVAILLTLIYIYGLLFRPSKQVWGIWV